jgi:hypothetical protein
VGGASRRCNTTTLNVILLTRLSRTGELTLTVSGIKLVRPATYAEDIVRWGVWLGRHIC